MMKISTIIGIAVILLIAAIAMSSILVGAQTPTETATATAEATPPASAPTTTTVSPSPTNLPALSSFTVDVTKNSKDSSMADVKLSIKINNFNATTNIPTSTPSGGKTQGLIKYCYDKTAALPSTSPAATMTPTMAPVVSPSPALSPSTVPTASASATEVVPATSPVPTTSPVPGGAIPTATSNSMAAQPGQCVYSASTTFTFTSVPEGAHTFSIELVNFDGSSLSPSVFIDINMMVIPTSGGGLFGAYSK